MPRNRKIRCPGYIQDVSAMTILDSFFKKKDEAETAAFKAELARSKQREIDAEKKEELLNKYVGSAESRVRASTEFHESFDPVAKQVNEKVSSAWQGTKKAVWADLNARIKPPASVKQAHQPKAKHVRAQPQAKVSNAPLQMFGTQLHTGQLNWMDSPGKKNKNSDWYLGK